MQKDKNSKNNVVEKLRKILDNRSSHKDFQSGNEKYLVSLDKRLKKTSDKDTTYKNMISKDLEQKDEDLMKPKISIHMREKKVLEIVKVKESEPKIEVLTIIREKEQKAIAEDVFEIEKVEVIEPRFIEVKPKVIIKETKETLPEKKVTISDEGLTEWESVEKKEIKEEFTKPKAAIVKKIEAEEKIEVPNLFCTYCNAPLDKIITFCPACGHKLTTEVEEEKPEPAEQPQPEPATTFIPVKKVEEEDGSLTWEPVEIEKPKEEIKIEKEFQIVPEEPSIARESKIEAFKGMASINEDTAILLYDNGFKSVDSLKEVSVKDLTKIKGVKRRTAKKIKKEIERKFEKTDEIIPIDISETAKVDLTEEQVKNEEMVKNKEDTLAPVELSRKSSEWAPVEEFEEETPAKKETISKEEITIVEELKVEEPARESKIEAFKGMESINEDAAVLLYNNGFTSIDSLKNATVKDLKKIKGIKRRTAKKIIKELDKIPEPKPVELEEKKELEIKEKKPSKRKSLVKKKAKQKKVKDQGFAEYFIDEDKKEEASKIEEKIKEYEPLKTKDEDFFVDEVGASSLPRKEENKDVFKGINSIDGKIAGLLKEKGITSVDALNKANIKDLVKIKGIKRKVAKNIKKEVSEFVEKSKVSKGEKTYVRGENPFIKGEDEWESYDEGKISEPEMMEIKGYTHGDFALYEKTIETKDGKKKNVRFFSKAEPEEGKPIELPDGYEVKENPKTGIPYIKKKK